MQAEKHHQEKERLAALARYALLDTETETAFEEVTWLASQICQSPIAIVNLIDADRQWFKSEIGIGVRETPLDISICAHAILETGLFMVPDTLADPRFAANPVVTGEPHLRFYAGALLESSDGYPLGTLCVLDYAPRLLTETQQTALAMLGRQVMTLMEARLRTAEVERLNVRMHSMITESHHRIKNSFQALAALVELQQPDTDGKVTYSDFARIGQHIRGISVIHDLLTLNAVKDAELTVISAKVIIELLLQTMAGLLGERPLVHCIEDFPLAAKQATTLTLLLNELISNAVKHGRGTIEVGFSCAEGMARLEVRDAGAGFPAGFDPVTAANTGLELIETLATWDLRGRTAYENRAEGGARVVISFPVESAAHRAA